MSIAHRLWEGGTDFLHLSRIFHRARSVAKATAVACVAEIL